LSHPSGTLPRSAVELDGGGVRTVCSTATTVPLENEDTKHAAASISPSIMTASDTKMTGAKNFATPD